MSHIPICRYVKVKSISLCLSTVELFIFIYLRYKYKMAFSPKKKTTKLYSISGFVGLTFQQYIVALIKPKPLQVATINHDNRHDQRHGVSLVQYLPMLYLAVAKLMLTKMFLIFVLIQSSQLKCQWLPALLLPKFTFSVLSSGFLFYFYVSK